MTEVKERILITGASGYMGNALLTALQGSGHEIFAVDGGGRKQWVQECGGNSLTNYNEHPCFVADLANLQEVVRILHYFRPTQIIHLASQPSAPYSERSSIHREFTQVNNLKMLLNLLSASKDMGLNPKFIVTTTTGVPGAPDQPIIEGDMPNKAGSWYHVSRGFDSANLALAVKQWNFNVLELRTSIVYGTRIDSLNYPVTRLDWDFYFGTALHRFVLRKKVNKPITIYGKGLQRKPIIALRDVVKSLVNAITFPVEGHVIMNQTTECLSVVDMAKAIGGKITHIDNPRVEKEDHAMVINNEKFMYLLSPDDPSKFTRLSQEAALIEKDIDRNLLPKDWERVYDGK